MTILEEEALQAVPHAGEVDTLVGRVAAVHIRLHELLGSARL